jgi:hypothetical protein
MYHPKTAVTVSHMSEMSGIVKHESHEESTTTSVVDLRTQLNQAYLSGDGAAVERVLALMTAAEDGTSKPSAESRTHGSTQNRTHGSTQNRTQGSTPDRTQGSIPDRTQGSTQGRTSKAA